MVVASGGCRGTGGASGEVPVIESFVTTLNGRVILPMEEYAGDAEKAYRVRNPLEVYRRWESLDSDIRHLVVSFSDRMYRDEDSFLMEEADTFFWEAWFPSLTLESLFLNELVWADSELAYVCGYPADGYESKAVFNQVMLKHLIVRGYLEGPWGELQELNFLEIQSSGLTQGNWHPLWDARDAMPNLKNLRLWMGRPGEYTDLDPLDETFLWFLKGDGFQGLTSLGLLNCQEVDAYVDLLIGSRRSRQFKTLDLSMSTLGDGDIPRINLLIKGAPNLEHLVLDQNYFTPEGQERLKAIMPSVDLGTQRVLGKNQTYRYTVHSE